MTNFTPRFFCWVVSIAFFCGLSKSLEESPCGDWIPYGKENCVKFVNTVGLQIKEDAETTCKSFAEEYHFEDVPNLITIKTEEKQKFLRELLFQNHKSLDNVWLGLNLGKDEVFRWNDMTELFYTNWVTKAEGYTTGDQNRSCVEMESGQAGLPAIGKWATANCLKRNAVVCERVQPLSKTELLKFVSSLKLQMEINKKEDADKLSATNQELADLKRNPVPIGFIYVQLPGIDAPTTLWPQTNWQNISPNYADLFFRVEGSKTKPFGQEQGDSTRTLTDVEYDYDRGSHQPSIPSNGDWSEFAYSGGNGGSRSICLRFRVSKDEVWPRNKAVRIWQRI